jgi:hypothetical protein
MAESTGEEASEEALEEVSEDMANKCRRKNGVSRLQVLYMLFLKSVIRRQGPCEVTPCDPTVAKRHVGDSFRTAT